MNYAQLYRDYNDLTEKWGDPYDMTGGFVDQEKFYELLKSPTKQTAAKILKSIIDYAFQDRDGSYNSELHGRIHREDCEIVNRIYQRHYED